jgi:hypothetical protein
VPACASDGEDNTPQLRQETAALRDFKPAYDRSGSDSVIRRCRLKCPVCPKADVDQRARHVRFAPIASEVVPCNDPLLRAATSTAGLNFFRSIVTFSRGSRPEFALRRPLEFHTVPSEGRSPCRARIPAFRASS